MHKRELEVTEKTYGQCRCCLKYAPVRNMWQQYKDAYTEREVYGKMLVDCYSISWTILEKPEDDIICENCVTRLREALSFKKDVLNSQESLLAIYKEKMPEEPPSDEPVRKTVIIREKKKAIPPKTPKKNITPKPKPLKSPERPKEKIQKDKIKKPPLNFVIPVIENDNTIEMPIMKKDDKTVYEVPVLRKIESYVAAKIDQKVQTDSVDPIDDQKESNEFDDENDLTDNEILVPLDESNFENIEFLEEALEQPENEGEENEDQPGKKKRKLSKGKKEPIEPLKEVILDKHRDNIKSILISSNATPIRGYWGAGYTCSFCSSQFPSPDLLKKHTFTHEDIPTKFKVRNLFEHVVKLDITDLRCNICNVNIDSLKNLMKHIVNKHQMPMHLDIPNHIIPYKFMGDQLRCSECTAEFDSFKSLTEHMNDVHYRNYECSDPDCNQGFVNFQSLKTHSIGHGICMVASAICGKIFTNKTKVVGHERAHQCNIKMKCSYANPEFTEEIRSKKLETKVQEVTETRIITPERVMKSECVIKSERVIKPERVICASCPEMFDCPNDLLDHVKLAHIEHKYKCTECDKSFFLKQGLKNHMNHSHAPKELCQCPICTKICPTLKALKDHMLTHRTKTTKYQCELCPAQFLLKSNYMGHMEIQHGLTQ